MKKILISLLVLTSIFGCAKSDIEYKEVNNTQEGYKYTLVADVTGQSSYSAESKAVKTDWMAGDMVFVFADGDNQGYILMTYDGSQWESVTKVSFSKEIKAGTILKAIHIPFADESYTPSNTDGVWNIPTGDAFYTYDENVVVKDVKELTIHATIRFSMAENYVQIFTKNSSVTDKTSARASKLSCNNLERYSNVLLNSDGQFNAIKADNDSIEGNYLDLQDEDNDGLVFYGKLPATQDEVATTFSVNIGTYKWLFYSVSKKLEPKPYKIADSKWKSISLSAEYNVGTSSSPKYVQFTRGNLQASYNGGNVIWRFAKNQYDIIGLQDMSEYETEGNWYDLFGWGATGQARSGATSVPFYTIGTTKCDSEDKFRKDLNTTSSFLDESDDWGANVISGIPANTFRTLSISEWRNLKTNYGDRFGRTKVNGIDGMILIPSGSVQTSYTTQQWETIEAQGAVFLPAAGYRNGPKSTHGTTADLMYWSQNLSNTYGSDQTGTTKYYLPYGYGTYQATGTSFESIANWRATGRAVRLVKYR